MVARCAVRGSLSRSSRSPFELGRYWTERQPIGGWGGARFRARFTGFPGSIQGSIQGSKLPA